MTRITRCRLRWLRLAALGLTACTARAGSAPLARLDFTSLGGLIYLPVTLADSSRELWNLDSGFEYSVVAARTADRLRLPLRGRKAVTAPGGAVDLGWTDRFCLSIAGLSYCADSVARIPLEGLEPLIGIPFGGVLGHDFLSRFVVRIDYAAHRIELFDPATFDDRGPGVSVGVWLEAGEPFLPATLYLGGRATPAKLKIDTGSLDLLGLNGSFVAQTKLIAEGHRRIPAPGVAVGGKTENYLTVLDSVAIAGFTLPRPMTGFSADLTRAGDAGTIGAQALSRFTVTFDYRHRRLILEPNGSRPASDASGLLLVGDGPDYGTIRILDVMAGTGGAEAGLAPGDTVLTVDGTKAAAVGLWGIRSLFERPDTTYSLSVRHAGRERVVALHTRPLL
ncbi:MAG: hypothetical protein ABI647_17545 [Gemmatimonadota bacterium]